MVYRTNWQSESVNAKENAENTGCNELVIRLLELYAIYGHEVYEQHAADESDCSEHPDGRESFHRVHSIFFQSGISY